MMPAPAPATEGMHVKKKRGRPRNLKPGEAPPPSTPVMSPKPISSSGPLPSVIDFSAAKEDKVGKQGSCWKLKLWCGFWSCVFLLLMVKIENLIEFDDVEISEDWF